MTDMQKTYSTTKICGYKNKDQCTLALDPGRNGISLL